MLSPERGLYDIPAVMHSLERSGEIVILSENGDYISFEVIKTIP